MVTVALYIGLYVIPALGLAFGAPGSIMASRALGFLDGIVFPPQAQAITANSSDATAYLRVASLSIALFE